MPRAWETKLKREEAKFEELDGGDSMPLDLSQQVIMKCDQHLRDTSLEHNLHGGDLPDNVVINEIPKYTELKTLFLSSFSKHNEQFSREDVWNKNELMFVALANAWYCMYGRSKYVDAEIKLRTQSSTEIYQQLMDSRVRLSKMLSFRHWHLIDHKHYETRSEKKELAQKGRLDNKNPHHYNPLEWMKMKDAENDRKLTEMARTMSALEIVEWGKKEYERCSRKREHEEEDLDDSPDQEDVYEGIKKPQALTLASHQAPLPFPEWTNMMDEVSFFITCYMRQPNWMKVMINEMTTLALPLTSESLAIRDEYTNQTSDGQNGKLWQVEPESYPKLYVAFASQLMVQVWCEYHWKDAFSRHEVHLDEELVQAAHLYVKRRMEFAIGEDLISEMRAIVFEDIMPLSARNMARRLFQSLGSDSRMLCWRFSSTNITENISEQFENETSIRVIGYEGSNHPLYDHLFMSLVQLACYRGRSNKLSMRVRCMIESSQLVRRGSDLNKTESMFMPRPPLITCVTGQWMVHHEKTWYHDPTHNSFLAAWLIYLSIMKHNGFHFQLDDDTAPTDLSYWEQTNYLGMSIQSLITTRLH